MCEPHHLVRVEVRADRLIIELTSTNAAYPKRKPSLERIEVPWLKMPMTRRHEVLVPESTIQQTARPIRSETRSLLIASIARGRRWLDELITDPEATVERIATRESCSVRRVNMTVSLAFLAPDLVKAAIEVRLPHGMGVARLCDLPPEWSRQYRVLGLPSP
jgi:site-specific DNA recombinase